MLQYEAAEYERRVEKILATECNENNKACVEKFLAEATELNDLAEKFFDRLEKIHAEAMAKCSDKALSVTIDCAAFRKEVLKIHPDELGELYTDWELKRLKGQLEKCSRFWENEPRLSACAWRASSGEEELSREIRLQRKTLLEAQRSLEEIRKENMR